MQKGLDIVADVHGHAHKLEELLRKMQYEKRGDVWSHPERTLISLGDLIDRGPNIPDTVNIVRPMVEAGAAEMIMGNHEHDAIGFNVPAVSGHDFARPHSIDNILGHVETLKQYKHMYGHDCEKRLQDDLDWFIQRPLYLDLPELRIAHACWNPHYIQTIATNFPAGHLQKEDLAVFDADKNAPVAAAVLRTFRGNEFDLTTIDKDLFFHDANGVRRTRARLKWWQESQDDTTRLGDIVFDAPPSVCDQHYDWEMFRNDLPQDDDPRPVIFGHYWMKGQPHILGPRHACIDFSIAKGGVLTAYRFDGEKELRNDKLVWV